MDTRVGPDVDDPVCAADQVQVVLDDEKRVAGTLQALQRRQEGNAVSRMQSGRRLIEHVDHAKEMGPERGSQSQALEFAR